MKASLMSSGQLIDACTQSGDAAAWEEFIRRFHPVISLVAFRTVRRWGETSREVVDDLVQETYLKLCADNCRLLRQFESRHPDAIFGYLKVVTANVVHDYFKALRSAKRGAGRTTGEPATLEATAEQGRVSGSGSVEREVLLQEIDACLRRHEAGSHSERDRRIFWLYYRQGLSARAIAALPLIGLSTKGVESTLLRLTRLVRSEIAERRIEIRDEEKQAKEKGLRPAGSF